MNNSGLYIDNKNSWFLRIQYVAAYYVNESLNRLRKIEIPYKSTLMDEVNDRALFDSSFRSCMIHYGFYNKGICAVKDEYLVEKPFFGLIESCFEGISGEDYQELLDNKIFRLSEAIEKVLIISTQGYRPFSS